MQNSLIGVIFDINRPPFLNELKTKFSHFIAGLHHDDRVYVFREDELDVPRYKSQTIAQMMRLKFSEFHLGQAIKQTYFVLAGEDSYDYDRVIMVVTDRYESDNKYGVVKGMRFKERLDVPTKFVFYGIGDAYDTMATFAEQATVYHCDSPSDLILGI